MTALLVVGVALAGALFDPSVVAVDLTGGAPELNPSFRDLLARVRTNNLAAYTHQDLPFERLVEALNPARSLARHPLFQVMFVLQDGITPHREFGGLRLDLRPVARIERRIAMHRDIRAVRTACGLATGGYCGAMLPRR